MTRPIDVSSTPPAKPATVTNSSSPAPVASQASSASATADTVSLSPNGHAAQLMAQAATNPAPDPALDQVAREIASDIYRPPPQAIADALIRFETALLKKKS